MLMVLLFFSVFGCDSINFDFWSKGKLLVSHFVVHYSLKEHISIVVFPRMCQILFLLCNCEQDILNVSLIMPKT